MKCAFADRIIRTNLDRDTVRSYVFASIGPDDPFALESAPLFGVLASELPRWVSWALGDLSVKLLIAVFALIPYRLIAARWSQPALA